MKIWGREVVEGLLFLVARGSVAESLWVVEVAFLGNHIFRTICLGQGGSFGTLFGGGSLDLAFGGALFSIIELLGGRGVWKMAGGRAASVDQVPLKADPLS